jgi:hypothetical protein
MTELVNLDENEEDRNWLRKEIRGTRDVCDVCSAGDVPEGEEKTP